jgi:hypothetical protein
MKPKHRVTDDDADHWRGLADAARLVAEQWGEPLAREMMFRIAENYDRLADHARQRTKDANSKSQRHSSRGAA